MNCPVIFIHKGPCDYLQWTVRQAAKRNDVHVISDSFTEMDGYNHTLEKYWYASEPFKRIYSHMSKNPEKFELFCFSRFFILREFMREQKLDVVLHVDSDILLFCDATEEWENFDQYIMTLVHRTSAHTAFFTYEGIDLFCNFLVDTYSNKDSEMYARLTDKWARHQKFNLGGGVCDMTLFDLFHYKESPARIGEMMQVINGTTFDHNINVSDGCYKMHEGHKDYRFGFGDERPNVWHNQLQEMVQFNSLHCQGGVGKKMIQEIYKLAE